MSIMASSLTYQEQLNIAAELIERARASYDIWWFYIGYETCTDKITNTKKIYHRFFHYDGHAHLVLMVIYLHNLFESRRRNDTTNLESLIKNAKTSNISEAAIDKAWGLMSEAEETRKKVIKLRNNLFAHRSSRIAYKEAFKKADITSNQLRELTDISLNIINTLLKDLGLDEQFFNNQIHADVERLFYDLSKVNSR